MKKLPCILVIEEDEDNRIILRLAFIDTLGSCQLDFVENVPQAIEFLQAAYDIPDLIIVSLHESYVSGADEIAQLRACPRCQEVCIVLLTEANHVRKISVKSADGHFCKPLSFTELVEELRKVCKKWLPEPPL